MTLLSKSATTDMFPERKGEDMSPIRCCVLVSFLLVSACATPAGPLVNAGIRNFSDVNKQVSRGAQPTAQGVKELADRHVATIINLRYESDDPAATAAEKAAAEATALSYKPFPLSNWFAPSENDVTEILAVMNDPDKQPVFVHCQRGADRTGTIIAIYEMTHDCVNVEDAIREARQRGMGWWQFPMRRFIRNWSRTKVAQPCSPAVPGTP